MMKRRMATAWCAIALVFPATAALADIHYVTPGGGNTSPYTNWAMAAQVIQQAVDAASSGDTVLVSNGVYDTGGAAVYGMSNRVALTKAVHLQSINGRSNTFIVGAGAIGPSAVRCVYLTNGAAISGFTLTNGHTQMSFWGGTGLVGGVWMDSGGGAWMEGGTLSDCTIRANSANRKGAGVYCTGGGIICDSLIVDSVPGMVLGGGVYIDEQGWLLNTEIANNTVTAMGLGGGVYCNNGGVVSNCTIRANWAEAVAGIMCSGGGLVTHCTIAYNEVTSFPNAYGATGGLSINAGVTVNSCTIAHNRALSDGGGVSLSGGTLNNCRISHNSSSGGGASYRAAGGVLMTGGTLNNCTIVLNDAGSAPDGAVGGVYCDDGGVLRNCIVYANTVSPGSSYPYGTNWYHAGSGMTYEYTCIFPTNGLPGGMGCISDNPQFASGELGLQPTSPCIDSGNNTYAATPDLDGVPRPLDGDANGSVIVDMGCYEYVHTSADSDDDGLTDGDEVNTYGTDPTDTNTDDDSHTDYEEMIADTDGTNSNDYFRIEHVGVTNSCTVRFACTNSRVYSLQSATNMVNGQWSMVDGQTNRPGEADGEMSLTDTNDADHRAYRVGVSWP